MKIIVALFVIGVFFTGCGSSNEAANSQVIEDNNITTTVPPIVDEGFSDYSELRSLYYTLKLTILNQDEFESTENYKIRVESNLAAIGTIQTKMRLFTKYDADTQIMTINIPCHGGVTIEEDENALFSDEVDIIDNSSGDKNHYLGNCIYSEFSVENATAELIHNDFYMEADFTLTLENIKVDYAYGSFSKTSTFGIYANKVTSSVYNIVDGNNY